MTRFALFLGIAGLLVVLVLYLFYLAKTAPFMDDNGKIVPEPRAEEGRKTEEIKQAEVDPPPTPPSET